MRRSLCAALILASGIAAAQQPWTVVVAEPIAVGVDGASASTFVDLLRLELGKHPGLVVLPRSRTPPEPCGDPGCGVPLAQRAGAAAAVVTTLSRLGDRVIVRYEYVAADGRVLLGDRATAATEGDLEPLSVRVAGSLATGRPLSETATTTTVTQNEARDPVRRRAVATAGLHIGAMAPVADTWGGSGALADLGFFAFLELYRFAAVAEVEILWTLDAGQNDPSAFGLQLNLGGRTFLDPEADTGVFLGGGLGFRHVAVSVPSGIGGEVDRSKFGIGLYGGAGIIFLRTSDVHVILDARYDVNAFTLTGQNPGGSHGLLVSLGLSYTKWGRWF